MFNSRIQKTLITPHHRRSQTDTIGPGLDSVDIRSSNDDAPLTYAASGNALHRGLNPNGQGGACPAHLGLERLS